MTTAHTYPDDAPEPEIQPDTTEPASVQTHHAATNRNYGFKLALVLAVVAAALTSGAVMYSVGHGVANHQAQQQLARIESIVVNASAANRAAAPVTAQRLPEQSETTLPQQPPPLTTQDTEPGDLTITNPGGNRDSSGRAQAVSFTATTVTGDTYHSADHAAKATLLAFWTHW